MSSVSTLPSPSSPAQAFAPWRARTPGRAQPWRSLASLGLDPDPEPDPGAEGAPGGGVPHRPVSDHRPIPQEA